MAEPTDSTDELVLVEPHHEHTLWRTATDARQQFFTLLSGVVLDPSEVVLIEHKDLPGRGMLVGEGYRAYVRQLERLVKTLSNRLQPAGSFRLVGTMTLQGSLEDTLGELRTIQGTRSASKFDDV